MGDLEHLKPYQFKPGQSGNPGGLAKGTTTITAALRKYARENPDKLEELGRLAFEAIPIALMKGELSSATTLMKAIQDRHEGAVVKETKLSGDVHIKRLQVDAEEAATEDIDDEEADDGGD